MSKRFPHSFRQAASRLALALLVAPLCVPAAHAQQKEAPASVAGRVTDGERGIPGIFVALISNAPPQRPTTVARAKTDAEGNFLLTGVPPGRYQILPHAPAYVVQGINNEYPPGRPLMLLAGEEVKDLDFRMERGGVITGRVTDADGNPVVGEVVQVSNLDATVQQRRPNFDMRDQMTDDRGVYRVYGLPAGRYRVSVGAGTDNAGAVSFGRRKIFRRTFHPDAAEEAQARPVEVGPGEEADEVDITVGRALKTYRASGRFVSAETGQPIPNVVYGYGALDPSGRRVATYGGGVATNARGEFQTEGLAPGRYAVFASPGQEGYELYSDPLTFDVADSDVAGLVVRLKRGATLSGVVQIEGVPDRAAAARLLSQVRIFGWVETRNMMVPSGGMRTQPAGPDGSFRLVGLRPGKLRVSHSTETAKGLSLLRVEHNGADVSGGIDVAEGAQLTGVRYVLAYGTAAITGQTTFTNGTLQPGMRLMARARRTAGGAGELVRHAEVDARGFFRIEGVPAGVYEVSVIVFGRGRSHRSEPQTVSISDGIETKLAPLVVDLSRQ
jgi:hypothetical protein